MIHGLRFFARFHGQAHEGPIKRVVQLCDESPLIHMKDENDETWIDRNKYYNIGEEEWEEFWKERGEEKEAGDVTGDGSYGDEDKELIKMWNEDFKRAREA